MEKTLNAAACCVALVLSACAGRPSDKLGDVRAEYAMGYDDGCSTAYGKFKKRTERYSWDLYYAQGWNDGYVICRDQWNDSKRIFGPLF